MPIMHWYLDRLLSKAKMKELMHLSSRSEMIRWNLALESRFGTWAWRWDLMESIMEHYSLIKSESPAKTWWTGTVTSTLMEILQVRLKIFPQDSSKLPRDCSQEDFALPLYVWGLPGSRSIWALNMLCKDWVLAFQEKAIPQFSNINYSRTLYFPYLQELLQLILTTIELNISLLILKAENMKFWWCAASISAWLFGILIKLPLSAENDLVDKVT